MTTDEYSLWGHCVCELMDYAHQNAPQLRRFLANQISDTREAQDLMQQIYLRILALKRPEQVRSPKAYLYRVAANIAYEHRLSSKAGPSWVPFEESAELQASLSASSQSDPETAAELCERLQEIAQRLQTLPPRFRAALLWHYRDGYTCDEIGQRLAIRRNRVKKYIAKAMARCRESGDGARTGATKAASHLRAST
jgi:RNA polymerase sigma factor (sigma-70 family)